MDQLTRLSTKKLVGRHTTKNAALHIDQVDVAENRVTIQTRMGTKQEDREIVVVNPPTLVPDPNGNVEIVVGIDEDGDPIVATYRDDPETALVMVLTQLAESSA